jgi:class 3 adenylate cyclase/tetratricopeptide (TPR) repeat protein
MREERKVVTVLFADLVGFTSRAEDLDPEEVRAVLQPYHAHLRSELERFGGTVEKFIGDAVMALFGAPIAHEDDPERAVRAALVIRDWALEDEGRLELRIAVNTGEALVSLDARPAVGEAMASGDVVNTAARLQAAAPVNGVLVGETTYRATSHVIDYREAEPVLAKGKSEPVAVWEALAPRARVAVELGEIGTAELVGRRRELETLVGALERTRQERSTQLVTLVGVPGIGKSRLVLELFRRVEADPDFIYWRHGRSLPYGEGVTYWALAEMVKAQAGILESDSADEAARKLREAAGDPWVESHLRPLAGLGGAAEASGERRGEAFAAWRRFFETLAEERPLVLVFEDLHWADEGLLDFVDHLVDWAGDVPLLAVCTSRPELFERRPGWGGGKPNAVTLSLSPLSDEDTARLLATLLERSVLPAETQSALLERAGGNPLYAEQYARLLRERDATKDLPLPETVQGIVAARLDGLAAEEKALLQDASVIGRVFWLGALSSMDGTPRWTLEERLHSLERKEFVRRERRSSVASENEYAFRHVLVRDVAYGQITRAARVEKHRLAAEWIESLGRAEDHAEMLAHHYLSALELSRAVGVSTAELGDRARVALREAGDRALALNAFPAAERFFREALALWPSDEPGRPQLLYRIGRSVFLASDRGRSELEEALPGLDPEHAAMTEVMLGEIAWRGGNREELQRHLDRAVALVAETPPSVAKTFVLANVSRFHMLNGKDAEAIRVGREALAMAEQLDLDELRAHALNNVGVARYHSGDRAGIDDLEQSIAIGEAISSYDVQRGYTNLASIMGEEGDIRRAYEVHRKGLRFSERIGHATGIRWLTAELALDEYWLGRWDEALRLADGFIAESEAGSRHYMEPAARLVRAFIAIARDDVPRAAAEMVAALEIARGAEDPQVLAPTLAARSAVLVVAGRKAEANALVDEFLAVGQADLAFYGGSADFWDAIVALGRGEELLASLRRQERRTRWFDAATAFLAGELTRAADVYREIGDWPAEARSRVRAAEQLLAEGRSSEADAEARRALDFYRSAMPSLTRARPRRSSPQRLLGLPRRSKGHGRGPARSPGPAAWAGRAAAAAPSWDGARRATPRGSYGAGRRPARCGSPSGASCPRDARRGDSLP